MSEVQVTVQVWEIREINYYGRFNREIKAWVPGYGLSVSLVEDKDCSLSPGKYHQDVVATVAEFFSGKKLISKI